MKKELKLAILIDSDNIPYYNIKGMLNEIAKFGYPTIKRIYGDWTKPIVSGWKPAILEHAIIPVQQYCYISGKNATDSTMIIDAMDILHSQKVDGFCLVSSDSDFTRLAIRLRESGMTVIGIGERKTPGSFIAACEKFIYLEILDSSHDSDTNPEIVNPEFEKIDAALIKLIKRTISDLADDDGWAFLAEVGNLLIKKKTDFDPRNYGYSKLSQLLQALSDEIEIYEREVENTHIKHIYVKVKENNSIP